MLRSRNIYAALLIVLLGGCTSRAPKEDPACFEQCLGDLTNLARLAEFRFGRPGMCSSYDRTGGNLDGSFFKGTLPGGRKIMADLIGPGVIRRIWMTGMPFEQKFYFYFDDERKPRLEMSYEQLTGKGDWPFNPPISDLPSGAGYCYLPITFAKRLIVCTDDVKPGQFFFYHINYEKFDNTGGVGSASCSMFAGAKDIIDSVSEAFRENQREEIVPSSSVEKDLILIPPSERVAVLQREGPSIIRELRVYLDVPGNISAVDRNALCRDLVLRMWWDDAREAAVEVPFGDFFCNAVRPRSFRSLPVSVEKGIYLLRFPMPFREKCVIELENDALMPIKVAVQTVEGLFRPEEESLNYLHAAWNQTPNGGRWHQILNVKGNGMYAGCYLVAIGMEPSWNILEGDESIFLNNEIVPSMHGTGLEDYFNGGWYYNGGIFTMPFSGVLERSGIRTTQFRFHIPDAVRYDNGLKIGIEFGHGNTSRGYMSSVAYWYSPDPAGAGIGLPDPEGRRIPADPLEKTAVLCEVFERERAGRPDEAIELCREYSEKYPGTEEAALMELRAVAYKEGLSGYDSVSRQYAEIEKASQYESVRKQAGILKWFHESDTNAVIVAHINGPYRLFLDGKQIEQGDSPIEVDAVAVPVGMGEHVLALEVQSVRPDPWVSLYFRSHKTNFWSDAGWLVSSSKPANWPSGRGEGFSIADPGGPFPWMRWFQFKPNAFVNAQYRKQLLGCPGGWKDGQKIYFRKNFRIE